MSEFESLSAKEQALLEALEEEEVPYVHYRFRADPGQAALRVDKFLMNRLEGISRNKLQAAARAGVLLINDQPVKPGKKVKPGDRVVVAMVKPIRDYIPEPEPIPLDLIYEDESLIVVHKPPGLVVHPGVGNYTGTLVNGLLWHFRNLPGTESSTQESALRPGLVHRLDKQTSGLMVVAKTEYAMTWLARQFFERTISRVYMALVWGDIKQASGYIDAHIGRHPRARMKMSVFTDGSQGKPARTRFRVLQRFGYVTLVACKLDTGRTHQIRVHMQHLGHPVFNDQTYGGDKVLRGKTSGKYRQFVHNCFQTMPRQALHARSLGFVHPETKQTVRFRSGLPDDFRAVLDKWARYYEDMKSKYND